MIETIRAHRQMNTITNKKSSFITHDFFFLYQWLPISIITWFDLSFPQTVFFFISSSLGVWILELCLR